MTQNMSSTQKINCINILINGYILYIRKNSQVLPILEKILKFCPLLDYVPPYISNPEIHSTKKLNSQPLKLYPYGHRYYHFNFKPLASS